MAARWVGATEEEQASVVNQANQNRADYLAHLRAEQEQAQRDRDAAAEAEQRETEEREAQVEKVGKKREYWASVSWARSSPLEARLSDTVGRVGVVVIVY
jgi:hypothetical protein